MPDTPQRIRVMALVPTLRRGGAERVVSLLLQHLDRERFAPELTITFDREIGYPIPPDVPVFVLEREPLSGSGEVVLGLPPDLEAKFVDSSRWLSGVAGKFAALVRRRRPHVIIASPTWAAMLAVVASEHFPDSTRLIARVDSPPSVSLAGSKLQELFEYVVRQRFNRSDHIIAVSGEVGRQLVEDYGVASDRVEVLNNPVDIARVIEMGAEPVDDPWFADDVPVAVFVGRLEPVKRVDGFLRALALALETRPVRCLLVGDGSQRGYLAALAKHLGIESHVRFAGGQANPFKFVRRATLFVLPSRSEGFANVLVEAMACGCPVIATDIAGGGNRELLEDGDSGLIVPLDDPPALAAAMLRLLEDEPLRRRLSERGSRRVEAYDLPLIMKRYDSLIASLGQSAAVPTETVSRDADDSWMSGVTGSGDQVTLPASGVAGGPSPVPSGEGVVRARPASPRPRDAWARVRLAFLVPSMEDAFMGQGTGAYLRRADRARFEASLIKINHCLSDRQVPNDVAQHAVEPRFGSFDPGADFLPAATRHRHGEELVWMAGVAEGLAVQLAQRRIDALVAQGFYASIVATMASTWMTSPPLVFVNMHSRASDFANTAYGGDLYSALMRAYFGAATRVLAPTEAIRRDLIDVFGVAEGTTLLLPDPLDAVAEVAREAWPAATHPWFEQEGVVFTCVVAEELPAGLSGVLCALAVARRLTPVRLLIAGDGPWRSEMESLVAQLDLSAAVDFTGHRFDPLMLVNSSRGLVHAPADRETRLPRSVIDAVVHGVPVVSIGGAQSVRDLLDAGRGVLVPPGDNQATAEAMLQIVWDTAAGQSMARRAREYLESLSGSVPRLERLVTDYLLSEDAGRLA